MRSRLLTLLTLVACLALPFKLPAQTPPAALPNTVMFQSTAAPPISAGWITVQNGHLAVGGQRHCFFGFNVTSWVLAGTLSGNKNGVFPNAAARVVLCAQLDNLAAMGVDAIRINDADGFMANNWFCAGNGPMTQTLTLDPVQIEAFDYLWAQCRARNIRIFLTLYQRRQLMPADSPPWPCDSFNEMMTTKYGPPFPMVLGSIHPWCVVDDGVLQFNIDFAQKLLTHVNQYTGIPLGKDPTLGAVTLQNERSITRDGLYFTAPVFASKMLDLMHTYCLANGITWKTGATPSTNFSMNKVQIQQFLAWLDRTMLMKFATAVRIMTPALIIGGTAYGNATYPQLIGPLAAGDISDVHFYSRSLSTDPNGFLSILPPAQRTPFGAALAGCSLGGEPQIASEVGFVAQGTAPLTADPDIERAQEIKAVVTAAIAQDLDALFLYAGGWSAFGVPGNDKVGAYDIRADKILLTGSQSHISWFRDLSLRTNPVVAVAPTAGLYGAGTGTAYQLFGPLTDPALLAVPPNMKVLLMPALAPTGRLR